MVYLTRFDEALTRAEEALAAAETLGNARYQAELLTFAIPICHMRNGDMAAAMHAIERGAEIAERIGHREAEALGSMLRGKMAMAGGHYEAALAFFRRTVEAADATGLPYLRAMGRCVLGTCFVEIGGPRYSDGPEYHHEAAGIMSMPAGHIMGAMLWSEIGNCALDQGELAEAKRLFDRALNEVSAPMYLMRPLALQGRCATALAEGHLDEARRWWDELDRYVGERQMMDHMPAVRLTLAHIEAAAGNASRAVEIVDELQTMLAGSGMQRLELDLHACRARWLDGLGRTAEAEEARSAGRQVLDDIAGRFQDPGLRGAFLRTASRSLDPVA